MGHAPPLLPANAALAAADEVHKLERFGGGDPGLDFRQGVLQLQAGAVEQLVRALEDADAGRFEAGALQAHQVEALGSDLETGVGEERRGVQVDARVAADHGEPADLPVLVHQDAAGEERPIFHFHVPAQQHAARDHHAAADLAIVGDVAGGHDEIVVADFGGGFGRRAARDREMLANLVAVADSQVAARAGEVLVQRIGAEHRAGGDFVAVSQGGPAFDVHVGFEQAAGADEDVAFDDTEFADPDAGPDRGFGMDPGGVGDHGRWIDGHEFVSYDGAGGDMMRHASSRIGGMAGRDL